MRIVWGISALIAAISAFDAVAEWPPAEFYSDSVNYPYAAFTRTQSRDVNGDGRIDLLDIQRVVSTLLEPPDASRGYDIDSDGRTTILDLAAVISAVLNEETVEKAVGENGLTQSDRATFYHLPEGSEIFPFPWFQRLISSATGRPFTENLQRFGLIVDPEVPGPYGLPIGLTVTKPVDIRFEMLGINCALCHVTDVEYEGSRIRVDGAPSQFDIVAFQTELGRSTIDTLESPQRLLQLFGVAAKSLESADTPGSWEEAVQSIVDEELAAAESGLVAGVVDEEKYLGVLDELRANVRLLISRVRFIQVFAGGHSEGTGARFGRLDAFGGARNILFGKDFAYQHTTAPVSFPHLWNAEEVAWQHWTSNTNSVMERNIGQALGVGGVYESKTMRSSVLIENLHALEMTMHKIETPAWPAVFPAIDMERAKEGRALYVEHCAGCHDAGTTLPNGLIASPMFTLEEIGTDPNAAVNFDQPVGDMTFPEAIQGVVGEVKRAYYARHDIPVEVQDAWELTREPVEWRSALSDATTEGKVYQARPLEGLWATAPYLHNNSVPTLYHLLLPPNERPVVFPFGHRDYDPVLLGYRQDVPMTNGNRFDTSEDGNSNAGHAFGTGLAESERMALLEYLKML